MVNAADSKSAGGDSLSVRFRPPVPIKTKTPANLFSGRFFFISHESIYQNHTSRFKPMQSLKRVPVFEIFIIQRIIQFCVAFEDHLAEKAIYGYHQKTD